MAFTEAAEARVRSRRPSGDVLFPPPVGTQQSAKEIETALLREVLLNDGGSTMPAERTGGASSQRWVQAANQATGGNVRERRRSGDRLLPGTFGAG